MENHEDVFEGLDLLDSDNEALVMSILSDSAVTDVHCPTFDANDVPDDLIEELLDSLDETTSSPLSPSTSSSSSSSSSSASKVTVAESNVCSVCHSTKAKHVHYGALVCASCRGFFRRAVNSVAKGQALKCKAKANTNKTCVIDSSSRRSCAKCRYQKCLDVGMNPRWMITIKERQEENGGNGNHACHLDKKSSQLSMSISKEEVLYLKNLTENMKESLFRAMLKSLRKDPEPIFVLKQQIFNQLAPQPQIVKNFEQTEKNLFEDVAFNLEDFMSMDPFDRLALMRNNFGQFFSFMCAIYFDQNDFENHLNQFSTYIEEFMSEDSLIAYIKGALVEIKERRYPIRLRYESMYVSPWCPDYAKEERHKELMAKLQEWPRDYPGAKFNETFFLLLCLCGFFDSSGIQLRNPKGADELQQKFAYLLYRYLKTRLGDRGMLKYGEGLLALSMAREAYEIHANMLPV